MNRRIVGQLCLALLVAAAVYIGAQLWMVTHRNVVTQIAILDTAEETATYNGVAAFSQVNLPGEGSIGYLLPSGTKVSVGTQVAETYTAPEQARYRTELQQTQQEIDLLNKAQNTVGADMNVQLSQIQVSLYNMLDVLDQRQFDCVPSSEQQYLLSISKLQHLTGQTNDFSGAIASLQQQAADYEAQLAGTTPIAATQNGYFVYAQDAKHLTVDLDTLENSTPAGLQDMLNGGLETQVENLAGTLVQSYRWNYYLVCSLEDANRFEQVGEVQVCFPGVAEQNIPAQVVKVTRDEGAQLAKVVLQCENTSAALFSLGQQPIQVTFASYEGLRVDAAALHLVNGQKGVYVRRNGVAYYRKITVLYQDETYLYLPLDGAVGTENEVRLYDEIIVNGTDLYDGKLL